MTKLPMIVKFYVKDGKVDEVKNELLKILEPTRNEEGCLLYELHQDLNNPNIFVFYEIWETVEAWKAHDTNPHINTFRDAIKNAVDRIEVNQLKIL